MEGINPATRGACLANQTSASKSIDASESIPLPERLSRNIEFWESFCTDKLVLSIIREGYKLKWKEGPMPSSWTKGEKY